MTMPYKNEADRLAYHRRYFQEHREEARTYARKHRDRINARRRELQKEKRLGIPDRRTTHGKTHSAEYLLLSGAKKRAKAAGLPFALVVDEVPEVPARCPVLGIVIEAGNGRMQDSSPTLDRIKPAAGYVAGNVRVISWRANRLRSDGTAEELKMIAADAAALEAACG